MPDELASMGTCTWCQDGTPATARIEIEAPEFDEPMEMRCCERHFRPITEFLLNLARLSGVRDANG